MEQDHFRRAGGLGEVVGREADPALGARQAEALAHGPGQEGIQGRASRPDAFLQPGDHQPVGAHEPGLDGAQDAQAGMGGAAGPHALSGHQPVQQLGEAARRGGGEVAAVADQAGQQPAHRLAVEAAPEVVGALGQGLHGPGEGGGAGGGGVGVVLARQGGAQAVGEGGGVRIFRQFTD
ncbi:hypothetical protein [Phenylobacterium sp. J367]|uniref:hypothetical protein n=1 Tax=Phenylobacterium sp. J367 TaxID=2898435 RepID=UPI0027E2211B|nr:hypothetical protein [Phenylobacterium sp. J367]